MARQTLTDWWKSQSPEKQQQINRRAKALDPNRDLYGHSKPKPKPKAGR